eukprot:scaffold76306_cov40-Cyclotella_meneghiniana.AAC.2
MIHVSVLMLNSVKKCNNLDHLKKYYRMKMTHLLDNEHYIAVEESEEDGVTEEVESELEIDSLLNKPISNPTTDNDGNELLTPYDIFAEDTAGETAMSTADANIDDVGDETALGEYDKTDAESEEQKMS